MLKVAIIAHDSPRSVRHEDGQTDIRQCRSSGSAEHELTQPTVAIGAHDKHAGILRQRAGLLRLPHGPFTEVLVVMNGLDAVR